jgi:hypothetical protein
MRKLWIGNLEFTLTNGGLIVEREEGYYIVKIDYDEVNSIMYWDNFIGWSNIGTEYNFSDDELKYISDKPLDLEKP